MFIQIQIHNENTLESNEIHLNTAQIGTIQFGAGDAQASLTVGPDAFTTKDPNSIKALRTVIILSQACPQSAIDIWGRIRAYEAQDAALGALR